MGTLALSEPDASVPAIAGAKAANLALAASAGLPVVDGFVITTDGVRCGLTDVGLEAEVRAAWEALTGADDTVALAVRSSSTVEDASTSSLAGRFTSVLDVQGWPAFIDAVVAVANSAAAVSDAAGAVQPMAVLVQRQITATLGGVLFGVDPVTGARDRVVVEVVATRPDQLVGGTVTADHYVLSRHGGVVDRRLSGSAPPLTRPVRRQLVRLASRAEAVFGSVQDLEWAVDAAGSVCLLQSRPVTAVATPQAPRRRGRHGVTFGPGPVAETFPDPLRRLEAELWLVPLSQGIEQALRATGAASGDVIARSPVVIAVDRWAAVDLELIGVVSGRRSLRQRANPVAIVRRLRTAWRVGRLRVALPQLGADVVATVDRDLASIRQPVGYTAAELAALLDATRRELATVHTVEVLAGMLVGSGRSTLKESTVPAPIVALRALQRGRASGLDDAAIVARDPVVLALVPPTLAFGGEIRLPVGPVLAPVGGGGDSTAVVPTVGDLDLRDALRLRARWLQELAARLATELVRRLGVDDPALTPEMGRELSFDELAAMARGHRPVAWDDLVARAARPAGPPLPTVFELDAAGVVHPVRHVGQPEGAGLPASAGRAIGVACHRPPGGQATDTILVTRHLEPRLAPLLPNLAGLIAETGSALSHLAILAREAHVPTVVGVDRALTRFPPAPACLSTARLVTSRSCTISPLSLSGRRSCPDERGPSHPGGGVDGDLPRARRLRCLRDRRPGPLGVEPSHAVGAGLSVSTGDPDDGLHPAQHPSRRGTARCHGGRPLDDNRRAGSHRCGQRRHPGGATLRLARTVIG